MTDKTVAEILQMIIDKASTTCLPVHHCVVIELDSKDLPDLIIAGKNGCLFRKLRSNDGQHDWIYQLYKNGASVATWQPEDLEDGTIESWLEEIR